MNLLELLHKNDSFCVKKTCLKNIFFTEFHNSMKSNLFKNCQKKGIWRSKTGNILNLDGVRNQMSAGARPGTEVSSLIIECSGRGGAPHLCSGDTTARLCSVIFCLFFI